MAIEWTQNLSTGVEWQDRQHKELFNRITKLLDAMNVGLGRDEVIRLFNFLDEYFVTHFDAEEQVMNRLNYPDSLKHIEEHTRFIEDISQLRREAVEKGVTTGLVIQVQRRVLDWLVDHIGAIDKKFGAFVLEAEKEK